MFGRGMYFSVFYFFLLEGNSSENLLVAFYRKLPMGRNTKIFW